MRKLSVAGVLASALLVVAGVYAQDSLKSGPQVGKALAGPFHPLNCTGAKADEKHCLV